MKNKALSICLVVAAILFASCMEHESSMDVIAETTATSQPEETVKSEPHRYGGWYCPDNLNGFPPVDINNWKNVPVVNGRLPTKEETQNGTSLIFVDMEKYPEAKPLDMKMPQLARFYNHNVQREDIVIIIQVINVSNDSVVGLGT